MGLNIGVYGLWSLPRSVVPVSKMSTVAEPCLDTNFTDQLLSVEKEIRDLKASIKASIAS